jgi:uncharacterized protein HemY
MSTASVEEIAAVIAASKFTPPPTPEEEFNMGKQQFQQRQWLKAVRHFETAATQVDHAESMKYLADCYAPNRLANASKVSEWTKRRMAVLGTPQVF